MDWIRGEKLGHGSFATVSLAIPRGRRGSSLPPLMAVKTCGASQSSSLMKEKSILEELKDCPEIIGCFGESFSDENGEKLYNVLLEYASGGSLADKLKRCGGDCLPELELRRYTKALLRGLHYIHKFGYVHCDIKLQNILLESDGAVKIADFGLARRAGRNAAGELRGTPMYLSPEVVLGGEQGPAADIWALGCAVTEMAGGSPAWRCSDLAAMLMRIGTGEEIPAVPGSLSAEGKDFLSKCFLKDPRERWTAEMLLRHPFVDELELDDRAAATCTREECTASVSPRCPLDFPDWISTATCSITSLHSPDYSPEPGSYFFNESISRKEPPAPSVSAAERLLVLRTETDNSYWAVTDGWITVR